MGRKKKTILITGGAGFLGSHLCEKLLSLGHKVICMDNLLTGTEMNIKSPKDDSNFDFIEHDVEESFFVKADEIYNLACPAAPIWYQKDPVRTIRTNVLGAINILELAKKNGVRVLQASTSEVYGDPDIHPQTETYWGNVNPIGPRSCYDEGKRCAESLFFNYQREYFVDMVVARIFNTYGPRMTKEDGRVVSGFIIQALRGDDITVFGDGGQTRSFCYVDDMVKGLIAAMEKKEFRGPVNLGNPGEFTVKDLAEKVLKLIPDTKSKIVYKDLPQDDPKKRKPDISLAKKELNWQPEIELDKGLIKTIEYFKK